MNSNRIEISVPIDRQAALLKGHALAERETITVSPDDMSPDLWEALVKSLDMDTTPPRLRYGQGYSGGPTCQKIDEATPEALVSMLQSAVDKKAKADEEAKARHATACAEALESMREALATVKALEPQPCEYSARRRGGEIEYCTSQVLPVKFQGWVIDAPQLTDYSWLGDDLDRSDYEEAKALLESKLVDVATRNDEAFQAALPALTVEIEALEAAEKAKADAEAQAKAEKLAATNAKRLETGEWTMSYGSYNERRCGAPWCAHVSFACGSKGDYSFGESTGQWGNAGQLILSGVKPGCYIAHGQKDLRRSDRSEHRVGKMLDDGSIKWFSSKAEAYADYKRTS